MQEKWDTAIDRLRAHDVEDIIYELETVRYSLLNELETCIRERNAARRKARRLRDACELVQELNA